MTQFPSPYSAEGSDEKQWRRPEGPAGESRPAAPAQPSGQPSGPTGYTGPPQATPAPPGWRPPTMITVPAPRNLPSQDPDSIDRIERRALVTTYGVSMIAGAIGLVLLIVLCGRLVF